MVGGEQAREIAGERVADAVAESIPGGGLDDTALAEQAEVAAHGDAAEGKYGARLQDFEIASEIRAAVRELRWQRLIRGRRASERGGHVGVDERETVFAVRGVRLIGEAGAMERFVEKIAGAVAGEHAASAVGAMGGGSEAENQQLRARVAEAGDRLAPVVPIAVGEALFGGDRFAILHQPRAFAAGDDFAI